MRYQGRITAWKDDKGFGFITPDGGGEPVFVHISAFAGRQRRPVVNERVSYGTRTGGNGRLQADRVSFADRRNVESSRGSHGGRNTLAYLFAAAFLLAVVTATALGRLPVVLLLVYLAASVITFLAYVLDKAAAQQNRWRTQESTLHLLALAGGWPGALVAQRLLRHKSAKTSFQVTFWLTVLVNCGALIWLLGPAGAPSLRALFSVM